MQLTLDIPDETAAALQAKGVTITSFVEEMLRKEASAPATIPNQTAISAAVDRILKRRKGLCLDGLNIRDLIDEGRRF